MEEVRSSVTSVTAIRLHGVTPQMIILFTVGFCPSDNGSTANVRTKCFEDSGRRTLETKRKGETERQTEMEMGSVNCAVNT
jgi:hypothetical protein